MMSQPSHDAPTHETLVERLVAHNYSPEQAAHVAERLLSLSGDLHEALLAWWNGKPLPAITRGSYTLDTLQKQFGLTNKIGRAHV